MNGIQTCLYDTNYSQELDASVSLSLDAWTSSNGHAFLAIVMHWIDDDWNLGMLFLFYLIPIYLLLQRNYLSTFVSWLGTIQVRIWHTRSTTLSTRMASRVV